MEAVFRVSFDFKVALSEVDEADFKASDSETPMEFRARVVRQSSFMRYLLANPRVARGVMRGLALEEVSLSLDERLLGEIGVGAGDVISMPLAITMADVTDPMKVGLLADYNKDGMRCFFQGVAVDMVNGLVAEVTDG